MVTTGTCIPLSPFPFPCPRLLLPPRVAVYLSSHCGCVRLTPHLTCRDATGVSSPESSEAGDQPDGGYRRGSGGLVVRSHLHVAPLTVAPGLSVSDVSSSNSNSPPIDRSIAGGGAGTGAGTSAEPRRGSGKFVIRRHDNIPPLNTEVGACRVSMFVFSLRFDCS